MFRQVAALSISLLMTAGTAAPAVKDYSEFQSFLAQTNAAHAQIDAPRANLSAYRYDFSGGGPLLTADDAGMLKGYDGRNPSPDALFSAADARTEVDWLFRVLRTQYGLYTYAGGDAAFNAARQKILSALPQSGTVRTGDYEKLLTENLFFINDTHFMIGQNGMQHRRLVFTNQSRPFYNRGGAFYADAACTQRVLSVNGAAPGKMIRRAIGMDGELTWYLYVSLPQADSAQAAVQYADRSETIVLKPSASFEQQKPKTKRFGTTEVNGIPYVEINEMFFGNGDSSGWTNQNDEPLKRKVLKTADDLKKEPVAVIDLTHNPGGNGDLPYNWFLRYTGQAAQANFCTLRVRAGEGWIRSGYGAQTPEDIASVRAYLDQSFAGMGLTPDGSYYTGIPSAQFVPNDRTLFVLTSRGTASAAELFTDVLHNLQNTVFIGSNTGGVLVNAANYGFKLPYSGLFAQFGECLNLWDKDYFEESRGMEPDLYLTGDNLDERLARFLERYAGAAPQK